MKKNSSAQNTVSLDNCSPVIPIAGCCNIDELFIYHPHTDMLKAVPPLSALIRHYGSVFFTLGSPSQTCNKIVIKFRTNIRKKDESKKWFCRFYEKTLQRSANGSGTRSGNNSAGSEPGSYPISEPQDINLGNKKNSGAPKCS